MPVSTIWTRSSGRGSEIDGWIATLSSTRPAFVNLIGDDAADLKTKAEKFEKDHKAGKIALVVPKDQPNGPENYKLNKDADVTVIIAKEGKVTANHALKADGLNAEAIKKIVADAAKTAE